MILYQYLSNYPPKAPIRQHKSKSTTLAIPKNDLSVSVPLYLTKILFLYFLFLEVNPILCCGVRDIYIQESQLRLDYTLASYYLGKKESLQIRMGSGKRRDVRF